MLFETHGNFKIRLLSNKDKVQINVYNPQNETHSFCTTFSNTNTLSLEEFYAGLLETNTIQDLCSKATVFFSANPV